jgi:hypothetical protein
MPTEPPAAVTLLRDASHDTSALDDPRRSLRLA